ncbi:TIGR02530 family flagellar biosynthesis protein [Paenibacillus gansuensis]|uniref:TIGR02530 family flagellar biosynthesis protein n=1 Tax=Paenibacillus gansuensis TaxID=306542 RepID=A0ABW5PDC8_9BACL
MSDRITIGQIFPNVVGTGAKRNVSGALPSGSHTKETKSFQELLDQKLVKFSHHAETRLQQRGIVLKPEQMAKIETAIDKASAKGAKDSLFFMNDVALIVNIKNRTVVTAIDSKSMKDQVFTQIDSAIVIS